MSSSVVFVTVPLVHNPPNVMNFLNFIQNECKIGRPISMGRPFTIVIKLRKYLLFLYLKVKVSRDRPRWP